MLIERVASQSLVARQETPAWKSSILRFSRKDHLSKSGFVQMARASPHSTRTVRILDFMETSRVTGPAKNLIEFAHHAGNPQSPLRVNISMATFRRGSLPTSDEFTVACEQAGLDVHVIRERFLFDPAVIGVMRRFVAECAPDIVQTHSVKSHFLMR